MRRKNRITSFLMLICMLFGATPVTASAAFGGQEFKVEAEDYIASGGGIQKENENTTVGYQSDGSYMEYRLQNVTAGYYKVYVKVAAQAQREGAFELYVDGVLAITNETTVPATGGWTSWMEIPLQTGITFTQGDHTLKLVSRTGDWNIDYLRFVPANESGQPVEGKVSVSTSSAVNAGSMSWYQNSYPIENKWTKTADLDLTEVTGNGNDTTIYVDPEQTYQEILGFGTSLEESTIYNLAKMDSVVREQFLRDLIDPENGAGMTLFRLTIGTADFTAQNFYTYYDNRPNGEPDWQNMSGQGFSIQKDYDYHIIETIQQVIRIAEELGVRDEIRFFSSPWTPPGWMKTASAESNSYPDNGLLLKGGTFNSDFTEELAEYYVRYLEEYAKIGIPIYAMTLQNEPYLEINYPSCSMTAVQQAALAKAMKEKIAQSSILKQYGVNPQLWGFDHNFNDGWKYVNEASGCEGWSSLDGIAFHPYGGDASAMGEIARAYPDKNVYLTERAVWGTSGANDIITWLRNSACSYDNWVTMLDSNIQTHQWVGTPDPTMFVQNASNRDNYWALPEFYIVGQFARYIRPGFVRVESSAAYNNLSNVVCKNPKTGELVMVVSNQADSAQDFRVICENTQFSATIPAQNVATYVWNPMQKKEDEPETDPDDFLITIAEIPVTLTEHEQIAEDTYYIDVEQAGDYTLSLELVTNAEVENGVQIAVGTLDHTNVVSSFMAGNTWNNTNGQKDIIALEQGKQTLKITAAEGISISGIVIQKKSAPIVVKDGLTEIAADQFYRADHGYPYGIETKDGQHNIGCNRVGTSLDYMIEVSEAGNYYLSYVYGSASSQMPVAVLQKADGDGVTEINRMELPPNGSWDNFITSEKQEIFLEAGTYTLRISIEGDGFNYRKICLEKKEREPDPEPEYNRDIVVTKAGFSSGLVRAGKAASIIIHASGENISKAVVVDGETGEIVEPISTGRPSGGDGTTFSLYIPLSANKGKHIYIVYVLDEENRRSEEKTVTVLLR